MKHYGYLRLSALLMAAAVGFILLLSEVGCTDGTVFAALGLGAHAATLLVKAVGLAIVVAMGKVTSWLYGKGELGDIDKIEE